MFLIAFVKVGRKMLTGEIEGLYSPACMLPIFAKAPCCLDLFGCCCRKLSQHGVGEVLIPLRHCWRDALASHCSVLFWSLDELFVFGLPPLPP